MDDQPSPRNQQQETKETGDDSSIAKPGARQKNHLSAQQAYEATKRLGKHLRETAGRLTTSEWITAIFTAVIAGATIWNVIVVRNSLEIMQGQLIAMEADQRPWISIDSADPITPMVSTIGGNLAVRISIRLLNTGHSPARYVLVDAKIFVRGVMAGATAELRPVQDQCDVDRTRPIDSTTHGITLFPGKIYGQPINLVLNASEGVRLAQNERTTVMIAGCVDYVLAGRPEHHQTAFVYELDRMAANGNILKIEPKDIPIPSNELILEINPGLAANAD